MTSIPHIGEGSDHEFYTHKRWAARNNRTPEWVLDNFLYPTDKDGNPIPGVPCLQMGKLFWFTGEALRLWLEEQAQSQPPRNSKQK